MNRLIFIATSVLALNACAKTREQFDFSKKAPDEFAVIKRAPLEMPQDMTALDPPRPGAPRPQELSPTNMARASVVGVPSNAPANATAGEIVLLEKANAVTVPANIRNQVDAETDVIVKEETPTIERIMGLTGKKVTEYAVEVDPTAEANRIKANKAAGRPVSAGETATRED